MSVLEILLGQIPEALYFVLFIIFTNEIKTKRICFIASAILEYVLLLNAFPFDIWSHILFIITLFLIMKLFYKEKCQVTDIFTLGIASIIIILVSVIVYFPISLFTTNTIIGNIIQKLILFILLITLRKKLPNINKLYKKMWNRNKIPKKLKSTTFRALNVFLFNISFYIINIGMLIAITFDSWR